MNALRLAKRSLGTGIVRGAHPSCGTVRGFAGVLEHSGGSNIPAKASSCPLEAGRAFIVERGYSPEVARGIVESMVKPGTGITKSTVMPMLQNLAGHYDIGEDNGLEAMAKAIEQEMARLAGKQLVMVNVRPPKRRAPFTFQAYDGMNLKEVAEHGEHEGALVLGEYLECACDGIMACSTCHVVVDPAWFARVGKPSESELDMLDLAFDPQETSRLGCQIVLTPELDGLIIEIPSDANNLFDHVPFG